MALINDMSKHINVVMESMGWPEDAFIPIANDENRQLMKSIEQQIEAKQMKLSERVKLLKEHHQNAQNDVVQNLVRTILMVLFLS